MIPMDLPPRSPGRPGPTAQPGGRHQAVGQVPELATAYPGQAERLRQRLGARLPPRLPPDGLYRRRYPLPYRGLLRRDQRALLCRPPFSLASSKQQRMVLPLPRADLPKDFAGVLRTEVRYHDLQQRQYGALLSTASTFPITSRFSAGVNRSGGPLTVTLHSSDSSFFNSCSRSTRLSTLPVAFLGSSSMKWSLRGILKLAKCSRRWALSLARSRIIPSSGSM